MSQIRKIKLNSSCLLTVPLQVYNNDFSFIVNGEEFKTSKLISDLLSPIICQIHLNDPTFDLFIINTHETGNFSHILDLLSFKQNNLPDNELSFILEVLEILDNQSIEFNESNEAIELTVDNIFSFIKEHEKHPKFFNDRLHQEIEFISSHFNELCEAHEEEFEKISLLTLNSIFENKKLELESEDQLLRIVNKLYMKDVKYSILYETVLFENVSVEAIKDFISIYDNNDMTASVWRRLSDRLLRELKYTTCDMKNRYKRQSKFQRTELLASKDKEFKGIINFLRTQSNGQIDKEICFTSSSLRHDFNENHMPRVVSLFEDRNKYFETKDEPNSWLMLDFKEHRVAPTDYTIRSVPWEQRDCHLKSWIVEGSNGRFSWHELDKQIDCGDLNGKNFVHTFKMKNETSNEYRYVRFVSLVQIGMGAINSSSTHLKFMEYLCNRFLLFVKWPHFKLHNL